MRFLSNGDFGFPFSWSLFFSKQFYLWSYQTGALNADGVMRMPGRLVDLAVFMLFGNLAFEYFFIFSSLAIVFASFLYFAYKFLEIRNTSTLVLSALFYTLNPIFLGNLSKIGLVLAAAMLPLCLVMVREVFEQKRFRYLFVWVVLLNVSLIHPFTFAVNLFVSGIYLAYQAWLNRSFVVKHIPKFMLVGVLFLALNAYIVLPLMSMHTVSKNTLSDTITSTPTDYTALVDVLNTGDIFTGLSLSKNVVKDYDFYSDTYMNFYFLGAFGLYALLLFLYLRVEKRFSITDKRRALVLLAAFLVLIALATVTFLHIDALIKILINTPGGWALRSPLKWQLYIPLTLFGLFVLCMKNITVKRHQIMAYVCLIVVFVLMDSFLMVGIYRKLLTPRSIRYFSALQQINLDHQNLLFVSGSQCWPYEQDHPAVMTELNQVLGSKNVQVKRINVDDIDQVNLASYDHIVSCQGIMHPSVSSNYDFTRTTTFASNAFQLYTNKTATPYAYATTSMFALQAPSQLGAKSDFVSQQLQENFNFVTAPTNASVPTRGLQDAFENLTPKNIHTGSITTSIPITQNGTQEVYLDRGTGQILYYSTQDGRLSIATTKKPGYQSMGAANGKTMPIALPANKNLAVSYDDPAFDYQNLIKNPSFEQGPWQKQVGDCYDYDDEPKIAMSINAQHKTAGQQSLQLESANHIACTGPPAVPVKAGQQYLLSFNYWSPTTNAGYRIHFDDDQSSTLSGRLTGKGSGWHSFTKVITAPNTAHTMQLQVEVFADYTHESTGIGRFDNFQFMAVPNVTGRLYVVSGSPAKMKMPAAVDFATTNPTKTTIHIRRATTPFYLGTSESFSAQWRLELDGKGASSWMPTAKVVSLPGQDHVKLNGSMNGWYIDPSKLCRANLASCTRNPDGSYDLRLVMEFTTQRWLYAGMLVSGITFLGGLGYFIYDVKHDRRKGVGYHPWR
ncbi:MAG TPA: hypothetical protein VLF59_04115 [Candidatus Saccharimonadales bacterium]|nr:hypothetical protein [Candidatus Saccharimonadales bacterium]